MIRERLGTVCVSLLVLWVAFARFTEQARGDLYTNGVLCLDWLVDSSDEIVRVQFPQSPDVGLSTAEPLETLKPRSRKGSVGAEHLKELRLFPRPEPGEQWLLLFRLGRDGSPRMFRGLNLTRPLAHYSSAAVTREGRSLRAREAVLAAVEARIRLGRQLPSRCDRDAVDQMIGSEGRFKPPEIPIDAQVLANPSPLDRYLGGVRIAFDCGQWDSSERDSLDTILDRAVVSIEPEDRERIFEASRLGEKYEGKPRYYDPVYALVNYPGEEAEGILRRIVAESDGRNYRSYHEEQRRWKAQRALRYLMFCQEPSNPLNMKLVGNWRLVGQRETIDVTFAVDNTFTAAGYRPDGRGGKRLDWRGKGYWMVSDGRLSIHREFVGIREDKSDWTRRRPRDIFLRKKIIRATPNEVVLEHGPPMIRR